VLAAQTDTEGDPAGSGRLAWAAAGCLCYWAGSCIRPPWASHKTIFPCALGGADSLPLS